MGSVLHQNAVQCIYKRGSKLLGDTKCTDGQCTAPKCCTMYLQKGIIAGGVVVVVVVVQLNFCAGRCLSVFLPGRLLRQIAGARTEAHTEKLLAHSTFIVRGVLGQLVGEMHLDLIRRPPINQCCAFSDLRPYTHSHKN